MTPRITKILLKMEFYGHCKTWPVAASSGLLGSLSNQLARLCESCQAQQRDLGAVTPPSSPQENLSSCHPVCKHSLVFTAALTWNIFLFEINRKSKPLFSGRGTLFLLNSTQVESALKQGSLKPAAALLLGFPVQIFLIEVFKVLLKILKHFL